MSHIANHINNHHLKSDSIVIKGGEILLNRYGKLTVLKKIGERLECVCDCGKKTTPFMSNVKRGNTISCGCSRKPLARTDGLKRCSKCDQFLKLINFSKDSSRPGGINAWCRKCCGKNTTRHRKNNKLKHMLWAVSCRAKRNGIPCNIDLSDLILPKVCPLLGIDVKEPQSGKLSQNSPSIDRKDPSKGYTKGNVWIISHRANTLKNNATIEELELLISNLKKIKGIENAQ